MRVAALSLLAACTGPSGLDDRARHVVDVLAEDNYLWAVREPDAVAMKLAKMQRDPFDWLRGTAGDVLARRHERRAAARATTKFGDPASSRVLLVADPHSRTSGRSAPADGTMVVDWNDFDSAGYGPYRSTSAGSAASLIVATDATTRAPPISRTRSASATPRRSAALAAGSRRPRSARAPSRTSTS